MKKLILMFALVLGIMGCFTALSFAASNPDVTVNGNYVNWTDSRPYIDSNNRTMVPLRATMESCGLEVWWDEDKREALVTDGNTFVRVPVDKRVITINRVNKNIDTNAVIKNGRIYLPIRAVAEAFGYTVCWSDKDNLVSLIKLNRHYYYDMYYLGDYVGDINIDPDGYILITWQPWVNLGRMSIAPTSMFKYNGEMIIKSNTVIFVIDGYNPRILNGNDTIYLY